MNYIRNDILDEIYSTANDVKVSASTVDKIQHKIIVALNIIEVLPEIKKAIPSNNDIQRATEIIATFLKQLPNTKNNIICLKEINEINNQVSRYKSCDKLLMKYKNIFDSNRKKVPTKQNIQNLLYKNILVILFDDIENIEDRINITKNIILKVFNIERLPRQEMTYSHIEIKISKRKTLKITDLLENTNKKTFIYNI